MIDEAMIRQQYANLHDAQLIAIAREEGHNLTAVAFDILKNEINKRDLDSGLIAFAEQNKNAIHQEKIRKVQASLDDDFIKAMWKYVIEEKEDGTPDSEILSGLREQGIDEPHAALMLSGVKNKLKELVDHFDTKMLVGGITFIIGSLVTALTYTSVMAHGGYYVVAWGNRIRCYPFLQWLV